MLKTNNITLFFDEHFYIILVIHIVLSLLLAFYLHFWLKKRFISNDITTLKDLEELKLINTNTLRGKLLKFFFQYSFHKYNPVHSIMFLFFLNFSMPLFGYVASLWIAYYLKTVRYKRIVQTTHMLNLDEFETIFNETKRIFGESSLLEMMTNDYIPKTKKLQAIASLASNINPTNLRIIQETLKSKEDEIRLFGYAILNKEELALNNTINKTLEELRKEETSEHPDQEKIAIYKKKLAYVYWEMVYNGFAQDILEKEFLKTIEIYAYEAERYFRNLIFSLEKKYARLQSKAKPYKKQEKTEEEEQLEEEIAKLDLDLKRLIGHFVDLTVLIGKIEMKKGDYQKAIEAFTLAIETAKAELNENLSFLYPYIAEIYFIEGRYSLTKNVLQQAQNLEFNAKLYPIVQQWRA
ncbi:MAG: hypothetical protein GXO11_04950 [Epsilonproteobacteria bacterium]|nr:hypothetical protein [Campylobacterota bacterium]